MVSVEASLKVSKAATEVEAFDVLVLGGGPAAISLVKMIGGTMKTAILRPEDHSMIYCAMPYAIEDLVPMGKTFKKDEIVTDNGTVLIRDRAVSVDFDAQTVFTEKGAGLKYAKLVIATGARPVLPSIPGNDLAGVYTFKTEEDMCAILAAVQSGARKAVVVGAGAIGVELAQALRAKGLETHLVDLAPAILPNLADAEMVEEAQQVLAESGIRLHLGRSVTALKGRGSVAEVVLDNGPAITLVEEDEGAAGGKAASLPGIVIFAVGMRAETDLFAGSALAMDKMGIVINGKMETSLPSVYAIGDCAHFVSGITGEPLSGKLATNAVPMGKTLGSLFLGREAEYSGFYNGAATKVGPWFIGGTGFTEAQARQRFSIRVGRAELTTAFPMMPSAKPLRVKLLIDAATDLIVGGQILGGTPVTDKVDLLTMAIQYKLPAKQLVALSYSAQPYQSYFPADHFLVHAVRSAYS
jgi:NADH dehydrogenase/NADH oxidase (H2O2-forming)